MSVEPIEQVVLSQELEFFNAHKDEWLAVYAGQFALVKGNKLLGTFTTLAEAFEAGLAALGNQPFLIRRLVEGEESAEYPALAVGMLSAHT